MPVSTTPLRRNRLQPERNPGSFRADPNRRNVLMSHALFARTTLAIFCLGGLVACGTDSGGGTPDVIDLEDLSEGDATNDASEDTTSEVENDAGDDTNDAANDTTQPDTGRTCDDNVDCLGGEVCRDSVCVVLCSDDEDCSGETPACSPEGLCVACVNSGHCGESERCVDQQCEFACDENSDCRGGELCDTLSGACYPVDCSTTDDCGDAAVCVDDTCIPRSSMVCDPGATRCDGDDLVRCAADGRSENAETCDADEPCWQPEGGVAACTAPLCEPDSIGCLNDEQAYLCSSDGREQIPADCRSGQLCVAGVCIVPECEPDSVVCSGDVVVTCSDEGSIVSSVACADTSECRSNPAGCVCSDGACERLTCTPESGRCVGNAAQRCNADGSAWAPATDCGDNFCVAGECREQLCEPSSEECVGEVLLECSSDGGSVAETNCAATSRICTESGSSASCIARVCTPSTSVCDAAQTSRRVCDARGASLATIACDAGTYCSSGACVPQVCTPGGADVCSGNDVTRCNSLGSAYETVTACGAAGCTAGACNDPCASLPPGHLGCEFWAVDLDNYGASCATSADCGGSPCLFGSCPDSAAGTAIGLVVVNPGVTAVTATVSLGTSATALFTANVPARGSHIFTMSRGDLNGTAVGTAWRIRSSGPVLAAQHNPLGESEYFSADSSLLLPVQTLGTSYVAQSFPQAIESSPAFVTIVATQSGSTTVTYRGTAAIRGGAGGRILATEAGATGSITLSQGEAVSLAASAVVGGDLSGSTISATRNVAVFAGGECTNVPNDVGFCDHIEEQMIPSSRWGTQYVAPLPPQRGEEPGYYRVTARDASTTIRTSPVVSGLDGVTLAAGASIDFFTYTDTALWSTRPFGLLELMVGSEYATDDGPTCARGDLWEILGNCSIPYSSSCDDTRALGDPASGVVVDVGGFAPSTTFRAITGWAETRILVVAASGATVLLNGSPMEAAEGNVTIAGTSTWSIRRASVAAGIHTVSTTHPDGVGVMVYGLGCGTSYMHPASMQWAP